MVCGESSRCGRNPQAVEPNQRAGLREDSLNIQTLRDMARVLRQWRSALPPSSVIRETVAERKRPGNGKGTPKQRRPAGLPRELACVAAVNRCRNLIVTGQPRYVRLRVPLPLTVDSGGESYAVEMRSYWDSLPMVAPQLRPQECHALIARPAQGSSDRRQVILLSREFGTREELETAIETGWDITGGISPVNLEAQPIIEELVRLKAVEDLSRIAGWQNPRPVRRTGRGA